MSTKFSVSNPVKEGSYAKITVTLSSEATSVTWTLTDKNKNIINEREDVSVSSPSTEFKIQLSGVDTTLTKSGDQFHILTIKAIGLNGKLNNDECWIPIENLLNMIP